MPKQILLNEDAINKLKSGVDKITDTIKLTFGPRGRNVFIQDEFGQSITKDGATVSRAIELEDPVEQMGANLIKETATKTESNVGDGTTSSSILAQSILKEGLNAINSGSNPILITRGIKKGCEVISKNLEKFKQDIKTEMELEQVATIAGNDSKVGKIVSEVYSKIGKDGVVLVEDSQIPEISYEVVEGLQIDKGYVTPYFITNIEKQEAVGENYLVFLTREKLILDSDIIPIMEEANKRMAELDAKGLLLISEDLEGMALKIAVVNTLNGELPIIAVKAPSFGDNRQAIMEDIVALTGGEVFDSSARKGKTDIQPEDFGLTTKVVSTKSSTVIKGDSDIEYYLVKLKKELDNTVAEYDKEQLQQRIAKLSAGIASISVGGNTESETKELGYRVNDSVGATRSALDGGTVPGGGVALLRASNVNVPSILKDEIMGIDIVKEACLQPLNTLCENAGVDAHIIVKKIKASDNPNWGYNAETGKLSDLRQDGVLDTFMVVKNSLVNAVSVASLLLTTGATVINKETK